jgi:4-hydroxythreonine-4-phosphate dehydrogenase
MKPIIAITIGDINGIGPEVIVKACRQPSVMELCRPVVVGSFDALNWHRAWLGTPVTIKKVDDIGEAEDGVVSVLDVPAEFNPAEIGTPTMTSGRAAIEAIERAIPLVRSGAASALVTAPISKYALALAGSPFKGHTDMLIDMFKAKDVMMVLASDNLRVGLVTIHIPVSRVASSITRESVTHTLRIARNACATDFGVPSPRMAVLALNPHAGDCGAIGTDEHDVIEPAIKTLRDEGANVEGPFAADGFFSAHCREVYDMVIAMYHDQGLIPFKMQAAGHGVNVSCGLPIVRTSPDHGTAYSIAGTGRASFGSMVEAIDLARTIMLNRAAAGTRA